MVRKHRDDFGEEVDSESHGEPKAQEQPETKDYIATGPIVIKGVSYSRGDRVPLTEEEAKTLGEQYAPLEGVEAKDREKVKSDHESGVEAQKERIEKGPAETEEDVKAKEEKSDEEKEDERIKAEQGNPAPGLHPPVPVPQRVA